MFCGRQRHLNVVAFTLLVVAGCGAGTPDADSVPGRWYTQEQVKIGRSLFLTHCSRCHGVRGEGTADWRRTDANGNYPPPPLDGSAHAWHHPLPVLERTVLQGGVLLGGVMPGFSNVLNDDEVLATVAYFQSYWSDEVYGQWHKMNAR